MLYVAVCCSLFVRVVSLWLSQGRLLATRKVQPSMWWRDSNWWVVIIAGFTGIVVGWQAWEARKSAQAAYLSVRAGIDSDRAWLLATIVDEFAPVSFGGEDYSRALALEDNNRRARKAVMANVKRDGRNFFFHLTNKGHTPAKIVGGQSDHCFIDTPDKLPTPPRYADPFRMPEETFIVNGESFQFQPGFNPTEMWAQARDEHRVKAGQYFLILYGRVIYEDVFAFGSLKKRVRHETRWCYACMEDSPDRMVSCGPVEYTSKT